MKSGKLLLFLSLFLVTIFAGCSDSGKDSKNIVATIDNDYTITFNELQNVVRDWNFQRKYKDINKAYDAALDFMLTNQLKRIDFFETELNTNKELVFNIRRTINEELVTEYYNTVYVEKSSDEAHARQIYKTMDHRVTYQQLLFQLPQDATRQQIDKVAKVVKLARTEIENGNDFNVLAEQYSRDSQNSVVYQHFTIEWKQAFANEIDEQIFKLSTGDVRIYPANDGFHLIKVVQVETVPVEPFEKIKKEIMDELLVLNKDKRLYDFNKDKQALVNESSLKWNEPSVKQLVDWANEPNFFTEANYIKLLEKAELDNFNILTYDNGNVDFEEYLRFLGYVLALQPPGRIKPIDIKDYILEALRTDIIAQKARDLGLEKNIFNAKTQNTALQQQIVRLYNMVKIDSQIQQPNTEMLHEFYTQQKDSLYYQLHKVNIYAMIYDDKAKADQVRQQISNGTPFEKISGRWAVKSYILNREGEIESYLSVEKPYLGQAAIDLKKGEVAGPVHYVDPEKGDQYAVIKCIRSIPEKQLTYDDVKNNIAKDYMDYYKALKSEQVRNHLWQKYDIEIHEKVLSTLIKS